MKFRTKTIVVEAKQWFKDGDHPKVIAGYKRSNGQVVNASGKGLIPRGEPVTNVHAIQMMGKWYQVNPGNWIITESDGTFSVCPPAIFAMKYEPVEDALIAELEKQ